MLNFQTLFESIPGLYIVYSLDLVIVAGSDAYFRATKTKREEVVGRHLFEVFPDNPDDPNATGVRNLRASLENVLKYRQPQTMAVQKYDIRRPESEGGGFEERYWIPTNSPVFDENGEMTHIIHRAEDVTEFMRVQQQRNEQRQLNKSLQTRTDQMEMEIYTRVQELREVNEQLQAANEALSELDRAKTVFFSNISHEFRTPLTLMLSPLEDLLFDTQTPLVPQQRDRLELVQRSGLRLLKLVNTLLDFSRLEAGRMQASYQPIDLAAFTTELASMFCSLMKQAGLEFAIDCPTLPEAIYIDRQMWEKIVFNLLSNAFKFTLTGTITVRLQRDRNTVNLIVEDTGSGIPETEISHLFERFYQVKGLQGRSFEGSGIGLSLVQELVKLHGGSISVTSVLGQGSRFTVSIPTGCAHLPQERLNAPGTVASNTLSATPYLEEASRWLLEEAGGQRSRGAGGQGGRGDTEKEGSFNRVFFPSTASARILLADDNADMRDYMRRLLSQRYEVEAVADGMAALAAIQVQHPDLILSDVMMPGLGGYELLHQLRADPQTRELPVILLSARAGEEARVEGLAAGADDYLIKPFSARELLARVESTLKLIDIRKQAAQTLQASEQQLKLALETSKLGSWQLDIKTNVLSTSDQCKVNYGLPINADFSHKVLMERIHPEDRTWVQAAILDSITNSSNYEVEYRTVWDDGSTHWALVRGHIIDDEAGNPERMIGISIDISDRKQAEADLRETHVQLESALAAGAIYTWRWKISENLVIVNAAFAHLFGVDPVEATTGLPIELFVQAMHEEDRPQTVAAINQAIVTGEEYFSEYRVYTARGEERWLAARGRVEYAADGRPIAFPGALADITERKQAESALRQSEERYRTLFESIDEGFCVIEVLFDPNSKPIDYRFLEINPAFEKQTGLNDAQGKRMRELTPNHEEHWFEIYGKIVLTGQPHRFENRAEALHRWFDVYAFPIGQPQSRKVAILFNDITDRKQIEATLKASNERLKLLSEVANDLLLNEDPKVFLASLFEKISTYLGLEVYFNYLFQEDQQRLELNTYGGISEDIALSAKFLELGQGVCGYAVQHRQPAIIENALSTTDRLPIPVHHSSGIRAYASHPLIVGERVLGTLGLGTRQRDRFTPDELDLMQTVANQLAVALERSRLIAELQARAEALDRSNRIKDEFLAVLSHELRTPMNPILGWSKLLQQGKLDAQKTNAAIATIERNAQLQVQLIDDLLDISRILRGKMSLSTSPIDLNTVIWAALETVRLAAEAKSIQIQTIVSPVLGVVVGDAGRLQQVVWNLLSNAVKFTHNGGQVTIALSQAENRAQIQITDTGKGISGDFLPYVFEHFRQEDSATTRKFGGLGLGLAIVRQIVEMHGGTVTAESPGVGLGATFTVKIPLAPQLTQAPTLERSPVQEGDLNGIQILVVDDETDSRDFIAFVLEQDGAIVTAVASGTEALQAIAQSIPNIIISDIGMPEMDGYMLIRQIRTLGLEQGGQIPAIALTAYAGELDRQQAIAAGFQRHIAKPIDPETLVAIVVEMQTYNRILNSEFKI
ncbi:MAG: ATP-binding protein [Nostoc sp. DedQUE05]|uniref:ATP-binding protein n=1 Tax=Nostoc sp. DedQUE05 TaxID=3075391 RepID=UPI002AD1E5EA|nr:ATP-binding protein [Nostoc sp. DedQUE05]MDZ8096056.1 ATP-binding protein [Nostoc sp. DedQUE05]